MGLDIGERRTTVNFSDVTFGWGAISFKKQLLVQVRAPYGQEKYLHRAGQVSKRAQVGEVKKYM